MARKKKQNTKPQAIPTDEYDILVERMSKCQRVIEDLKNSEAWKILMSDMQAERERLDDHWQSISDEKQLVEARVLKMAVMHIVRLTDKYEAEYKSLKSQKNSFDNLDKEILKDYDGETNIE